MLALRYVSERVSLTPDLKHLQFCCPHNAIAEPTLLCESYRQVPIDLLESSTFGPNVSLLASSCQGSPAPYRRTHGRQHAALSKSRSQPALSTPVPAATLFLDAFALRRTVAMKATGTSIPKQIKASIGSKKGQRERTRKKTWSKEPEEPIKARVPTSPRPKALCPYTPGTRIEETHLRSLIHYCKPRCP